MLLACRTVSGKTPRDGRVEIPKRGADALAESGASFDVEFAGARTVGSTGTMSCRCRGSDDEHVHYFVESPVLMALIPGSNVDLEFDPGERLVRVAPALVVR